MLLGDFFNEKTVELIKVTSALVVIIGGISGVIVWGVLYVEDTRRTLDSITCISEGNANLLSGQLLEQNTYTKTLGLDLEIHKLKEKASNSEDSSSINSIIGRLEEERNQLWRQLKQQNKNVKELLIALRQCERYSPGRPWDQL